MTDLETKSLKKDWDRISKRYNDKRRPEQILEHYHIERSLAAQLKNSTPSQRKSLYGEVYNDLFSRVPHHPQFTRRDQDEAYATKQLQVLRRLIGKNIRFAEIGAGDAKVSLRLASECSSVVAIDVSESVIAPGAKPANFRFVLSDGTNIPLPDNSVDFVYSNQLMEHLHRDDAVLQLKEIMRVLAPGGQYFCITPSRITGPHDVSRYVDEEASGFHLVEYEYSTLNAIFRSVGFVRIRACVTRGGLTLGTISIAQALRLERLYKALPEALRNTLKYNPFARAFLGVAILGEKQK